MKKIKLIGNDEINVREFNMKSTSANDLAMMGGGHLVVGQDLDDLDGGFNLHQTFIGEMADWVLLNESLSLDEMKDYITCNGLPSRVQPLLYFDATLSGWELIGPTLSYNLTTEDVCDRRFDDSLLMFPSDMEKEQADEWCHRNGGYLPVPQNQKENKELIHLGSEYMNVCVNSWSIMTWLGITGNLSTGEWNVTKGNYPSKWNNFNQLLIGSSRNCTCASVGFRSDTWYCIPCDEEGCTMCHFTNTPILHLRGDLKKTGFDQEFFIRNAKGKRPLYIGFYESRILFVNDTWRMESTIKGTKSFAVMLDEAVTYPLGRHQWDIDSDERGKFKTELVLSICRAEQFPCDNGQCVPQENRCDRTPDCSDESDELRCEIISVPSDYKPQVSPPPTSGESLVLALYLKITSVRDFDLVGFKIALDLILTIKWKDTRLEYYNLRDDMYSNTVKNVNAIWLPHFYVESGSHSPAEMLPSSPALLLVKREHPPHADDWNRVNKEEVFDGTNNFIVYEKQMSISFTCQFYLQMYPFDSQSCRFVYHLSNVNKVILTLEPVLFIGTPELLEYKVTGATGGVNTSIGAGVIWVEIQFRNLFGYYVGNAFLPSIFLVIICYLTFWFSLDDFQDRIMVSLTSLLVLTGLLTQTSQSIPKTAYLKFIDVWYIVFIFIDFLIILVLVIIEGLRQRDNSAETMGTKRKTNHWIQKTPVAWLPQNSNLLPKKVNAISIVVFPVMSSVFMIIFFAIGLSDI